MRQHRLHSSRCLHRQGHMPAAREPCRYCGKPLAANDSWAQEQHRWHCPSAAPPSTINEERGSKTQTTVNDEWGSSAPPSQTGWAWGEGRWTDWRWHSDTPPPAGSEEATEPIPPRPKRRWEGPERRRRDRSPSPLSSSASLSPWEVPEHKRKQRCKSVAAQTSRAPARPSAPRPGITCSYCRALVKGSGHRAGDEAALRAHQLNSSRCLAAQGRSAARARCPWGCGKLLANGDAWALEQHSWHCPCWQPNQPAT